MHRALLGEVLRTSQPLLGGSNVAEPVHHKFDPKKLTVKGLDGGAVANAAASPCGCHIAILNVCDSARRDASTKGQC